MNQHKSVRPRIPKTIQNRSMKTLDWLAKHTHIETAEELVEIAPAEIRDEIRMLLAFAALSAAGVSEEEIRNLYNEVIKVAGEQ